MDIHDVLHSILDRTVVHDAAQGALMHDAITAHAQGFDSTEDYRKANKPVPTDADVAKAQAALDDLKSQRAAQAAAGAQQRAAIPGAAPVAVADTPASPTADPDAA
jgi:hypothetical protein